MEIVKTEIKAFKALNMDMTANRGGKEARYSVGETRAENVVPLAGMRGMHCCKKVVDTFMFYPLNERQTVVCAVTIPAGASVHFGVDDDYGFFATNTLKIERVIPWDEVFTLMTDVNELDLSYTGEIQLPDCIGSFVNLEYLNLEYTGIVRLPDSIGQLEGLRGLNLSFTGINKLPESIGKLGNLQVLVVDGTGIEELPDALANRWKSGEVCVNGFQASRRRKRTI